MKLDRVKFRVVESDVKSARKPRSSKYDSIIDDALEQGKRICRYELDDIDVPIESVIGAIRYNLKHIRGLGKTVLVHKRGDSIIFVNLEIPETS